MPLMDVRSHSVRRCRDNLWMRSDAGPLVSREFLSAYISGYVDGEGCFTVSIAPRAKLAAGWEVRPSLSVSQNGDRAEVLHALPDRRHRSRDDIRAGSGATGRMQCSPSCSRVKG